MITLNKSSFLSSIPVPVSHKPFLSNLVKFVSGAISFIALLLLNLKNLRFLRFFKTLISDILLDEISNSFNFVISARGLISCILLFPNINPSSKYVNSFNGVRSDILLYPKFKYFNLVKFLTTSISFILKFNSKFNLSSLVRLARGSIFVILLSPKLRISRFTKLDNGVRSDTGLSFITILVNLVKLDIGFKSDILL